MLSPCIAAVTAALFALDLGLTSCCALRSIDDQRRSVMRHFAMLGRDGWLCVLVCERRELW